MSKEILGQVNSEVTAAGAWAAIEKLFSSQVVLLAVLGVDHLHQDGACYSQQRYIFH
jgi:hypothetical protein